MVVCQKCAENCNIQEYNLIGIFKDVNCVKNMDR